MMRLRYLVPVLGFSSLVVVACTGDGEIGSGGDAGAAGEAMGGDGPGPEPAAGAGGGGGEVTGAGGGCAEDGTGTLTIDLSGLPVGVEADILIEGPGKALAPSESGDLEDMESGAYTVTVARAFDADPIVRTVFEPTVTTTEFCLADGGTQTIEVSYEAIPSSNKLWMPTDFDDELAGFSSQLIRESGLADADVLIDGPGSAAVAFDRDGNLWALGPTVADAMVARFPAADLGASGTRVPDVTFTLPEIECSVAISGLAFDPEGNLWLSSNCKGLGLGELLRIPAAELGESDDMMAADIAIAGLDTNEGLAFDADGNVWVAGGPTLVRYDAARLASSDADAPDLALTVTTAVGAAGVSAIELAFDKAGNLWGVSGDSIIFKLAAADLGGTGEQDVTADVSFHVGSSAIADTPAFDDSGNLWVSLVGGELGGFSPTQLGMSTGTGENVTPAILLASDSVAAGLPIAFFPAAEGLPLYHALPAP